MKKVFLFAICISMMLSSCHTAGDGALTGASFGAMIGSCIGGINGGPRGHDMGMLTGMAIGAATGAMVGAANEQADRESVRDHYKKVVAPRQQSGRTNSGYSDYDSNYSRNNGSDSNYSQNSGSDSGFDATNSGDDRLYDFKSSDYSGNYSAAVPTTVLPMQSKIDTVSLRGLTYSNGIEIKDARFVDSNGDGKLNPGEDAKIIFEFKNVSGQLLTNLVPTVVETTGNTKIMVSQSIHVESLEPGHTLRYTAIVLAKKSLRKGTANFAISVLSNGDTISKVTQFDIELGK